MGLSCLSARGDGVLLEVRVTPRSPRQRLDPPRNGRLIVRVNAPPADGAANEEVRKLLAKGFGLAKSNVRIARGETARDKTVELAGLTLETAEHVIAGFTA
ncbi:MAG: DUF167 domain-containing protein [Actinobacteria bacterium]|nr:DUF167 domain-containing protein [Actinomycetota bacterium]